MSVGLLISITWIKNKHAIFFFSKKNYPIARFASKKFSLPLTLHIIKKKLPEKRLKIKNVSENKHFLVSAFSII
jgi:hypothetical protein